MNFIIFNILEEILKKSFVQNKFNELSKYPLILKVIEYDKDKKTNNTIIKSSISKKFKLPKFLALNSPKELFFNESNLQSNSISLSSQRKSHPNPILNRNQMPKLNLSKINIRNSPINPDSPKKFYINTFEDENLSKEFIDNIYSPKFKKTQDKKTISVKKFEDLSKGNFLLPSIYEGKDKQKSLWINSSDNINREERKLQKTKPFIAKNISFNQIQMKRMKNNKKIGKILQNFSNNKIISLYEINKKLLLNQNYYY